MNAAGGQGQEGWPPDLKEKVIFVLIVGIAGGTGSGKTTFARALRELLGEDCVVVAQDSYYVANTELSFGERLSINYDHPDALEDDLLIEHLRLLRAGERVEVPVYDFASYARTAETMTVEPRAIVIVEGILVLTNPLLRAELDLKVFVDTDPDVRVLRRLMRDVQQRGRSLESVRSQYLETVKPMHEAFVEPSKRYADLIVPEGGFNAVALETVAALLRQYRQGFEPEGGNRFAASTKEV